MYGKNALGISLLLAAGFSHGISLQETVNTSVNYHPALSAANQEQQAAEYRIDEAGSGHKPQVTIELSTGRQWANNTTIRSFTDDGHDVHIHKADFLLRQAIYDGSLTRNRVNAAKSGFEASGHLVGERKQDVIFTAIQAHINVLRGTDLLELAQQNLAAHRQYLNDIEDRAEQGVITETDAHHARARYAFADASLKQQEEQYQVALQQYLEVVGTPAGALLSPERPDITYQTLDEALAQTVSHPSVQQSQATVKQARAIYEQTGAAFRPRFDFEIRSTVQDNSASSDLSPFNGQSHETFAGIVMTYDLSRGGADTALRKVTAAQEASAVELQKLAARDIREQIRSVWYTRSITSTRVPLLASYSDSLEKVLSDYVDQFSVNRRDLLDLLDRQVETFRAEADLINAQYDLIVQDYELLQATGQLAARFDGQ